MVLWMISRSEQRESVHATLPQQRTDEPELPPADNVEPIIVDVPAAKQMDDTEHAPGLFSNCTVDDFPGE